jgi:protein-tyrosine phosphatase
MSNRIGVLFVCLGNICRSPLAMGVFREVVEGEGLADRFRVDSAGTTAFHEGSPPDSRTVAVARRRGLTLEHAARQVLAEDLELFDYVLVMDSSNLARVQRLVRNVPDEAEVRMLREFDPEADGDLDVPDPYFGGADGFEDVHDMVDRACRGLLEYIRQERGL